MTAQEAEWQEYEEAVIGYTLVDWDLAQSLKGELKHSDFADKRCDTCWELFCHATSMDAYMETLSKVHQASFVSECMDGKYPASTLPWLAEKIKKAAQRRRIQQGIRAIWDDNDDVLEKLAALVDEERRMVAAAEDTNLPKQLHAATIAEMRRNDLASRITTGIQSVDAIIQGLRLGNVSVLGAEPSTGKTALALNIAVAAIGRRKRVLIFSLEMSAIQMMDRMISTISGIPYSLINNKTLSDHQIELFENTSYALTSDNKLYIYDTIYTVEEMGAAISKIKPDLVIVDFLQFCRTENNMQNTADRLEYIVSEFKRLAKVSYHTCHIMLLSQPSRAATKEGQSMFALKGSSGIEQGGDVIMLLDRPCVRDASFPPEQAQIRIAKNKFGRTGTVNLYFDGEAQWFRDLRKGEVFTRVDPKEEKPW